MKKTEGAPSGRFFVLSGPGGVGKSTIVARLERLPGVFRSVSVTSREPRPGEADGRDYRFVTKDEFAAMIDAGEFLEYALVAGNFYGTPKAPVLKALAEGKKVLVAIDVQGAAEIKKNFPSATLVFVEPPDAKALEVRMKRRGAQSEEGIRGRMELAAREMERAGDYDYRIVNDDLDAAVAKVRSIMEV